MYTHIVTLENSILTGYSKIKDKKTVPKYCIPFGNSYLQGIA